MPSLVSRAKSVLVDVPRHGKLAYCLMRDDRVPAAPKAVLLGALGILAVETFIAACPEEIRREHEEALKTKQSVWDRDVRDTATAARHGFGRFVYRIRSRVRHRDDYESISEVG